jgi:predicted AlkP superfamily pyrophosphatase or phosphodiesterase
MMRLKLAALLTTIAAAASAQPPRHAILIDVDGVRRDTFAEVYAAGKLPNFARAFSAAVWFDGATTVTPTVTMAAQASIATGVTPAQHGIVGNQWYEPEGRRLFDYMNSSGITCVYGFTVLAGSVCSGGLANRHLQAQTMYEAAAAAGLESLVIYNQYWKGSRRAAAPTAEEGRAILDNNALDYRLFDRHMAQRAIQELQRQGLPPLLTLYFAGADGIAHKQGIASQADYLASVIDPLLGEILDVVEGVEPDWRTSTLFVLTSDHGRSDVEPHAEDLTLSASLTAALPASARIAPNGGIAYIYLDPEERSRAPEIAAALTADPKLAATVAAARVRLPSESPRVGDIVVTLQRGHYFNNDGTGSQHGSVYAEDAAIPMLVAMPGVPRRHVPEAVSVTQVARTIAEWLGFPMESAAPSLPLRTRMRTVTRQ